MTGRFRPHALGPLRTGAPPMRAEVGAARVSARMIRDWVGWSTDATAPSTFGVLTPVARGER